MSRRPLSIPAGEVHLWYVEPERITDAAVLAAYQALLAADEATRLRRFVFAKDRHRHLVTRALVRTVLSRYAEVEPAGWVFRENAHGRPSIVPSGDLPPLRFNLSHTDGMILCAVCAEGDIGVDVEDTTRSPAMLDVADAYFSPAEVAALRRLPASRQAGRFFEYWTLKESYVKARGLGLSVPLEQFSFHLTERGGIAISFDRRLPDRPEHWQFRSYRRNGRHRIAVALGRAQRQSLAVRPRATVPLVWEGHDECW